MTHGATLSAALVGRVLPMMICNFDILNEHAFEADLSEILGRIARMKDKEDAAQVKLEAIKRYVPTGQVPEEALLKMAKLGAVVDGWMHETGVAISAVWVIA